MRILWISPDPLRTEIKNSKSSSGFWKEEIYKLVNNNLSNKIVFASPSNKREYNIQTGQYSFRWENKLKYKKISNTTIKDILWIINDFNPEIIHIHGTELPFGLISQYTNIPVVISLQGFYSESFVALLGNIPLSIWRKELTLKEFILKNSFMHLHNYWFFNSNLERKTVELNNFFIGRTWFDKNFIKKNNATAKYFHGNEPLRDNFYKTTWKLEEINRYSIYISSFYNPLKGFHILLSALKYLINDFPQIKIIVPGNISFKMKNRFTGNSYYRYLYKMINEYKLGDKILFVGRLNDIEISHYLSSVHIFCMPSLIENSSNALGEAQLIGVPSIVSSDCGGTLSIIKDNYNGLNFYKGDSYDLSLKIRELFSSDALANRLSTNSRKFAKDFYNRDKIKLQYLSIYKEVLNHACFTQ